MEDPAMTAVEMISMEIEAQTPRSESLKTKPIVVATDGSDAALPAFKVADMIRARSGCQVRVVSALEPIPTIVPSTEGPVIPQSFDELREKQQRRIVANQMKTFDPERKWSLDVVFGKRSEAIASYARTYDAAVIIVGTNKHGVLGRLLGEETAVDITRMSDVPVLIAASGIARLPKRVLISMDLNPGGMQHAPAALALLADTPSVSCVHVQPRDEFLGVDWAEYDREYEVAMADRFSEAGKSLASVNLRPDLIVLHGDVAREIVDFASYSKAELIVVGIRRKAGRSKAVGGRIARQIIRKANCSVLIVPNVVPAKSRLTTASDTNVIADPHS
jgi:nucleotide-binding universal stress UspA family protein